MRTNASRRRAGFTLIELLLVLVIVATLAALVAPRFIGQGKEAKIKSTKGQIAHFESAIKLFESEYGRFPTDDEGLDALVDPPAKDDGSENDTAYLEKAVPLDEWGSAFFYKNPGEKNPRFVDIYSAGPDGKEGTDDDVGNWADSGE